jgi:signal transduction histidine kinase
LSREAKSEAPAGQIAGFFVIADEHSGIRTHVLLVFAMALVIVSVTAVSLLLVRQRLSTQLRSDLSQDLKHSVITFEDLQAVRLTALERENALLADLPTLKALMTSSDDLTIRDGAVEFWNLSGNDMFALADPNGRVVAAYTRDAETDGFQQQLVTLLRSPRKRYVLDGNTLYACAVRPLYFGTSKSGSILGYVITGVSIERSVRQISQPTGVEATFISSGKVVASTLSDFPQTITSADPTLLKGTPGTPNTVLLGSAHYLAATEDLSSTSTSPLQLLLLKSLEPSERSITRINRLLLFAGLLALVVGTVLMVALSRLVTLPLEELSRGVRAFGEGDVQHELPVHGTREVRELSALFARMRNEISRANQALLESERLATIGRMANSVSHDLRHYLAAVFANAEFLASERLSQKERTEIFAEIRTAVEGTTDMIESLLTFSRTGDRGRRTSELMATLLERAVTLVRSHPDAEGVVLTTHYGDPTDTAVYGDAKQIERAIYNLLLNACQAVRQSSGSKEVHASMEATGFDMVLSVSDNGSGIPQSIRDNLFDPFVSAGKQKGTGLGLTIASAVSIEHGGQITLVRSRPGETVFQMRIPREVLAQNSPGSSSRSEVIAK